MDGKVRKEGGKPVVFTANRLRDGKVVWLAADASWSETIAAARIYEGAAIEQGKEVAAEGERRQEVVGIYHLDVTPSAAGPVPVSVREALRAQGGPSTLYGLAEREAVRSASRAWAAR